MSKKDFSIRYEVEVMAKETLGVELTDEQIDQVVEEIEQYDTFLNLISLFVVKGIQDVAKTENISLNEEEVAHQLAISTQGINLDDF